MEKRGRDEKRQKRKNSSDSSPIVSERSVSGGALIVHRCVVQV